MKELLRMGGQSKEVTLCPKCRKVGYWIVEPEWKTTKKRKYKKSVPWHQHVYPYYRYKGIGAMILREALNKHSISPLPYEGQSLWKYLEEHFTEQHLRDNPRKEFLLRNKNLLIYALYKKVSMISKEKYVMVPYLRFRFGHYEPKYYKKTGHARRHHIKRIVAAKLWRPLTQEIVEKRTETEIFTELGLENPPRSLLKKIRDALDRL